MKWTLLIIALLGMIACKNQAKSKNSISTKDSIVTVTYSDKELIRFLDSVSKLDPNSWTKEVSSYPDSVYNSQKQLKTELAAHDFEQIKKGSLTKNLDINLFKSVFPDEHIDSLYLANGFSPVIMHSFSKNKFDQFAMEIYIDGWQSNVYFFDKNKIIAKHHVFHKYGLKINHFLNQNKQTVIYYKQNFQSGTGIWWWHYNFFCYSDHALMPVLNELESANLQWNWGIRSYWFETILEKTNPLTFKMVYYNEFPDTTNGSPIRVLEDSTEVTYSWDSASSQYSPDFTNTKLNRYKMLSYYVTDNELLFINTHYNLLKILINGTDQMKRKVTLAYLNEVKNECKRQQQKKTSS